MDNLPQSFDSTKTLTKNLLEKTEIAFIGCGVMAESIVAGILRQHLVKPEQIVASHPRAARREELRAKYGINVFGENVDAAKAVQKSKESIVCLSIKPQRIKTVLDELENNITPEQLTVSIVAGAKIETIESKLKTPLVVRVMPNTPSQIGAGMTAWTCTDAVSDEHRKQVRAIFGALGKELFVETENMIDMATALSATGPTYVFLVMEAMMDAGVHLGFSRDMAKELVQQTILGSVLFAIESHKHPAELRNMVTSPGGTSAEAIYQMEKGSLRTVLSKAIYAAYQRAVALGQKK